MKDGEDVREMIEKVGEIYQRLMGSVAEDQGDKEEIEKEMPFSLSICRLVTPSTQSKSFELIMEDSDSEGEDTVNSSNQIMIPCGHLHPTDRY